MLGVEGREDVLAQVTSMLPARGAHGLGPPQGPRLNI